MSDAPGVSEAKGETSASSRIVSMDQFRGYTVAGMFVVNFLGGYAAIHPVMKHNNNYFSYADSIMPSFMFAAGFSYQLTALRRLRRLGAIPYGKFIARGLGLVLVSLMMYGFGESFKTWDQVTSEKVSVFLARLVKANLWEVLAIIGVSQILILPFIGRGPGIRAAAALAFAGGHMVISYLFNFDFVFGRPNPLDEYLGTQGSTAWDGGVFGLLMWSTLMLIGSLAYDVVASTPGWRSAPKLIAWGASFLLLCYALSCLSMLYDGETPQDKRSTAASPVFPPLERLSGRAWSTMLAEPPLVQPPPPTQRPHNYWMMHKRIVSIPFVAFSAGWALALYGIFVVVFDSTGWGIGLFRTFGQNALAAYVLHHMVEVSIHTILPKDAPLEACMAGLAVFFAITYVFVRFLEKQGVYIRL
ncbi:MAG: heparan-alpha-glucosaminide N-acetyltransferase domain-containing protein [Isosphaeraceae bacterium]